jgi:hypothetical protein
LPNANPDTGYSAASSFRAVDLMLGKVRWASIECPFQARIVSLSYRVRRSVAYGIVSFADFLAPATVRFYARALGEDICDVAIGIVATLNRMLPMIDETQCFVDCLFRPTFRYPKWRPSIEVAK